MSHDMDDFTGRVPLLACGCSDVGCAAVTAVVTIERGEVVWDDVRTVAGEKVRTGPFRFARRRYDSARTATDGSPSKE